MTGVEGPWYCFRCSSSRRPADLNLPGVYRRSSEITLRILRENKDSLMSVLETFLHDPLVEWKTSKSVRVSFTFSENAADISILFRRTQGEEKSHDRRGSHSRVSRSNYVDYALPQTRRARGRERSVRVNKWSASFGMLEIQAT